MGGSLMCIFQIAVNEWIGTSVGTILLTLTFSRSSTHFQEIAEELKVTGKIRF